jgi:glycosyltransferase involved in cell wall biosynthesis
VSTPFRLAYVVTHPIQYQAPLLRRLAACPELDLTVLFLSDMSVTGYHDPDFERRVEWDVPLLGGYRHEFLPAVFGQKRLSALGPFPRGLRARLGRGGFDAVWVHGYAHPALLASVLAGLSLGLPVLLRGESHLESRPRGGAARLARRLLLGRLLRSAAACLAIGSWNRDYYRHHGVPERRIFPMPYAVDNEYFAAKAREAAPAREGLRRELGLDPGRSVMLFASKLVPRKRAADLVAAHAALDVRDEQRPYLLIVGDGPERALLESRAAGRPSVRFVGFRNQSELPRYYELADVFVLPSEHEPWGLAVNEAMSAARAVIVSDRVGASADLVRDGENGFVVGAGDVAGLKRALERVLLEPGRAAAMGRAGLQRIERWSFAEDEAGLLAALRASLGPRA